MKFINPELYSPVRINISEEKSILETELKVLDLTSATSSGIEENEGLHWDYIDLEICQSSDSCTNTHLLRPQYNIAHMEEGDYHIKARYCANPDYIKDPQKEVCGPFGTEEYLTFTKNFGDKKLQYFFDREQELILEKQKLASFFIEEIKRLLPAEINILASKDTSVNDIISAIIRMINDRPKNIVEKTSTQYLDFITDEIHKYSSSETSLMSKDPNIKNSNEEKNSKNKLGLDAISEKAWLVFILSTLGVTVG